MAALDVDQPTRAESAGFIGFRVAKRLLRVRPGPRHRWVGQQRLRESAGDEHATAAPAPTTRDPLAVNAETYKPRGPASPVYHLTQEPELRA